MIIDDDFDKVMESIEVTLKWKSDTLMKLIKAVLDELEKQGFKEVFLWTLEENDHARQFYERNGFSCTGEYLNDNIGGKDLKEVRYVCSLI